MAAEITQDGSTVRFYGTGKGDGVREWAVDLAPLAARSLKNLSWKSKRSRPVNQEVRPYGRSNPARFIYEDGGWEC